MQNRVLVCEGGGDGRLGLNEILLLSTVKVGPVMYASYDIFYMIW